MKSKAVIFPGKNQVEFDTVNMPDPTDDDVVIETKHSWISNGTFGSFLRGERWDGITPWHESLPSPFPIIAGYQKVGIVESVGKNVKDFKPGQWVFNTIMPCPETRLGIAGHVSKGAAPVNEVYAIDPNDDPQAYSGLVLTQVGYNGGSRPPAQEGEHAVVMGDGMVGNWAAQTLQQRGVKVALVGLLDFRLNLFECQEGSITVNARDKEWFDKVLEWAGGAYQIVVDTVGNRTNYDGNAMLVKHFSWGGHFVAVGDNGPRSLIDISDYTRKEITLHMPCAWTRERMETTRDWIHQGKIRTLPLVTDHFKAEKAADAFKKIATQMDSTLGIILDWD